VVSASASSKSMDVYFSYWTAGQTKPLSNHLRNMHTLSAHLARKHYGKITMLTDSEGANDLSDIGYDAVETVLDEADPSYARVWSLGKIHAYKHIAERGRPFLHLDYDVLLHKPLPVRLTEAKIFTQSPEKADGFLYDIPQFKRHCPDKQVPPDFNWPEWAWNMGIFGGVDCEFVTRYADVALSLIYAPANQWFWQRSVGVFSSNVGWVYATIPEQFYLEVVRQLAGMEISSLFPSWPTSDEATELGYTHLMASKNQPEVVEKISQRCKQLAA
jgi:hypothetical protein